MEATRQPMRTDELQFMVDYDAWATQRVLTTAERISDDEFAAAAGPGQVAPRSTLLHSISGMRNWREWLQGTRLTGRASEDDVPTLAAVSALWRAEHALLRAYVVGVAERDLEEVVEVRRPDRVMRAERWQFVVHVVTHNLQHRSELAQGLTLLGHSPGELGLTAFLQQRQRFE